MDPEIQALVGIDAEDLARFRRPAAYAGEGGSVRQPAHDPTRPHQVYPPKVYAALRKMSDVDFGKRSEPAPPVTVAT